MIPRVAFTVDGQEVPLDDWSCSNTSGLGYDQFRGTGTALRARKIASQIEQGSVIKAFTESGGLIFEGSVPADPKITQDGLAFVAAQGYGYQGAKSGDRISVLMTAPGAWVPANQPPLNWQSTATVGITYANALNQRSFTVTNNGAGDRFGVAFPAKGMQLTQLRFGRTQALPGNEHLRIYTADYPDIARTARMQAEIDTTAPPFETTITFGVPGDVVIIEQVDTTGGTVGTGQVFTDPVAWGDYALGALYSHHAAWIVARQRGWDPIGVTGRGVAPHSALDWTGDSVSFMSYIAGIEDFCWGVWEDQGSGPVMQFEPYGRKTWEVSAATGAHWDMDPLEKIRRITIQFFNVDNTLNEISLEATDVAGLPDTVTSELKGALTDAQSDVALPLCSAFRLLQRFVNQRYRGHISLVHAFDSNDHRDAPYDIRSGDLLKIVDFAPDGSITLRIHDVAFSPTGVEIGVETLALGLGGPITGAGGPVSGVGLGPQITSTTGGTATYIPPGSRPIEYRPGVPGPSPSGPTPSGPPRPF